MNRNSVEFAIFKAQEQSRLVINRFIRMNANLSDKTRKDIRHRVFSVVLLDELKKQEK